MSVIAIWLSVQNTITLMALECGGESVHSPLKSDVDGLIFEMGLKTKTKRLICICSLLVPWCYLFSLNPAEVISASLVRLCSF